MVTKEHEAPIDLFRRSPNTLVEVMRSLDVDVEIPEQVKVDFASERCTENKPTELTCDAVPLLKDGDTVKVAVVFEVQRGRIHTKPPAWVRYVSSVWAKHKAPTVLLVYCENETDAQKANVPIVMGPGNVVTPVVLSPSRLPAPGDIGECVDRVDLAVVAALMHSSGQHYRAALDNLTGLLSKIADDQAEQYAVNLIEILPDEPRKYLEDLMTTGTYSYQDAFSRIEARAEAKGMAKGMAKGVEQGVEKGEAQMLLRLLTNRGFTVSDEVRSRVTSCGDSAVLVRWFDRALTATTVDEVFEER